MLVKLKKAKALLRQGEILGVPTETVFGMAVDMYSEEGILKLYNLKGRSTDKPFVIQTSESSEILPFLSHIPFDLEKVMSHFWPGPLTLVLPINEKKISGLLRGNLPTAAFRVTQNESTRKLIQEYGPLAITSANRSGQKDLLSVSSIEKEFGKDFPILLGEDLDLEGKPSTILAYVDASWVVLRLGALSLKKLNQVLGYYPPVVSNLDPKSGHYSLRPQLHLMDRKYDGSIKTVIGFLDRVYPNAEQVMSLGELKKPAEVLKNISKLLKQVQQEGHPHVWVDMDFAKTGLLREVAELLEHSTRTSP